MLKFIKSLCIGFGNKLLFIFFLCLPIFVNAQDAKPVEISVSKEKVLIANKVYFVHIVQKSETLYAISRAYGVTQKQITDENPTVEYGLKVGQALKIPTNDTSIDKKANKKKKGKFIEHEVQQGQTLYFISRKYNVPLDLLITENPEAEFGIRPKQIIRIPKQSVNSLESSTQDSVDLFIPHKVEKQETLYSISRFYNVTVEDIIKRNPKLVSGLKAEDTIYVPQQIDVFAELDTLEISDTLALDEVVFKCKQPLFSNQTIKVAVLLPFQIFKQDSVILDDEGNVVPNSAKTIYQVDDRTSYILEFYEGFLIAVDTLKKLGQNIDLYVYDTKRDSLVVKRILQELDQIQPDIMFGPLYTHNLKLASAYCQENEIPLVSPISKNEDFIKHNPYFVKVLPSRSVEIKKMAQYVATMHKNHLILVHDGNPLYVDQVYEFRDDLFSTLPLFTQDMNSVLYQEVVINDTVVPDLAEVLYGDTLNTFIVLSHREAYASPIISQLNLLKDEYPVSVVGLAEFQKYQNIDLQHLHDLNLRFVTPFYMDYESPILYEFIKKYRNTLGPEPVLFTSKGYNFTMLGYDIGFYFINGINLFRSNLLGCLPDYYVPLILSGYNFERVSLVGGFENKYTQIIEYKKDYTTGIVNFSAPALTKE